MKKGKEKPDKHKGHLKSISLIRCCRVAVAMSVLRPPGLEKKWRMIARIYFGSNKNAQILVVMMVHNSVKIPKTMN